MQKINLFIILAIIFSFNSCENEDEVLHKINLKIQLENPEGISITQYKDVSIKFKEINTNIITEKKVTQSSIEVELYQGSYEISLEGTILYKLNDSQIEGNIGAFINQLTLLKTNESHKIPLSLKSLHHDLIFEEIFFTGTITPEGISYFGDKYFKLYNNTENTIYADGLVIAMSAFQTVDKLDYTPDIMDEAFTSDSMIQIPGNGTDYPVEPGQSIIISDTAINHKEYNVNSFDLSDSDFEMYYVDTDDVDNHSVTNVVNLYDRIVIHDRGFNSFVLFRLPQGMTNQEYLKDYFYEYEFDRVLSSTLTVHFVDPGMKVMNDWIVDAVNLSVESEFQWLIMDSSLDSGWTHCGTVDLDESRYGHSVQRKVIQNINGKRLLQDTNNSTIDFIPLSTPSVSKN